MMRDFAEAEEILGYIRAQHGIPEQQLPPTPVRSVRQRPNREDLDDQIERAAEELQERQGLLARFAPRVWKFLATTTSLALAGGILTVGGSLVDQRIPVAPSDIEDAQICATAIENVGVAVDRGIDRPEILENVNPNEVDERCGDEAEIAADIRDD